MVLGVGVDWIFRWLSSNADGVDPDLDPTSKKTGSGFESDPRKTPRIQNPDPDPNQIFDLIKLSPNFFSRYESKHLTFN